MPAHTAPSTRLTRIRTTRATPATILKRRLAVVAIAGLGAAALLAPATSARQALVHAFLAKNGTTVVSGYDGGAPVAKSTP
jgi:hypothetical protein